MSLVNSMLSGSYSSIYESVDVYDDSLYDGEVCENYLEPHFIDNLVESTVGEIASLQEAILVADVIGEVKVITEGVDPHPILEGFIQTIGQKIKEFFTKIFNWFKNLFASFGKKREEEKNSDEVKKLNERLDQLSKKLSDLDNNPAIRDVIDEAETFEMYDYTADPLGTISTEASPILTAYKKYGEDAKTALTKALADIRTNNKDNKENKSYDYSNINTDLDRHKNLDKWDEIKPAYKATSDTYKDLIKNAKQSKNTGDYYKSSTTDAERMRIDANIADLEEKYNNAKNNKKYFGQLDKNEVNMSMTEILKYRARGKCVDKKTFKLYDAMARLSMMLGAKLVDKNGNMRDMVDCIVDIVRVSSSSTTKLYKDSITNVIESRKTVQKLEKDINSIISDINNEIKKRAKGTDDLQKLLTKISAHITSVVNNCTQVAQTTVQMATEITSVTRQAASRAIPILEREVERTGNDNQRESYKIRKEHDKDFKKGYDTITGTKESTSLIESAFMSGLIG